MNKEWKDKLEAIKREEFQNEINPKTSIFKQVIEDRILTRFIKEVVIPEAIDYSLREGVMKGKFLDLHEISDQFIKDKLGEESK